MRSLAFIAAVLMLAAACGGEAAKSPAPTKPRFAFGEPPSPAPTVLRSPTIPPTLPPFTPQEAELVSPPGIDTSAWLTYRDPEAGFEFKYPPDAGVKEDTNAPTFGAEGVGTEIDVPFRDGTTLQAKYLFIQRVNALADQCVPSKLTYALVRGLTPDVQLVSSTSVRFWRTSLMSAGAMHWGKTTLYMTFNENACIKLSAVLAGVSPYAYSTPPPSPDEEQESEIFDAIIATFRWTD